MGRIVDRFGKRIGTGAERPDKAKLIFEQYWVDNEGNDWYGCLVKREIDGEVFSAEFKFPRGHWPVCSAPYFDQVCDVLYINHNIVVWAGA